MRYNFWDLLGDVGGFHDGLYLLLSLFMASYSSYNFKSAWLHNKTIDTDDISERFAESGANFKTNDRYSSTIEKIKTIGTKKEEDEDSNPTGP